MRRGRGTTARSRRRRLAPALVLGGLTVLAALAGSPWSVCRAQELGEPVAPRAPLEESPAELSLVRVTYDSVGGYQEAYYVAYGRHWQRWETDYPEAERNFATRLRELTRIRTAREPTNRRLTAPDVFAYPLLYMSDVGWMELSTEECDRLREYLRRGGFLWVDDFWGESEWGNLERVMRKVLPDTTWREIPADHPIRRMAFEIDEVPQIPARDFAMAGFTSEPAEFHRQPGGNLEGAHLRGWFDESGELLVVASFNTDVGDGFEREAYGQWYFETYSTRAYALGVNILLYAFTH